MKTTEQLARLQAIADDATHPLHRTAVAALRKLDQAAARAQRPEKTAHAHVRRYRVNGEWKLTERIADYDADGDVVNGASDRVGAMSPGRTLRPVSVQAAPALAPEPKLVEKPGWAGVQRNAADESYRPYGQVRQVR